MEAKISYLNDCYYKLLSYVLVSNSACFFDTQQVRKTHLLTGFQTPVRYCFK